MISYMYYYRCSIGVILCTRTLERFVLVLTQAVVNLFIIVTARSNTSEILALEIMSVRRLPIRGVHVTEVCIVTKQKPTAGISKG